MTALPEGLPLAAEFPDADREQWQHLVEGVLRKSGAEDVSGARAEAALTTAIEDGLTACPLYTAEDDTAPDPGYPGFPPFVRGGRVQGSAIDGWDVRQPHADPDPKRANEAVLTDLENGVGSLWLTLGRAGLPVTGLPELLRGVYLDLVAVVLDAGVEFPSAAEQLLALYAERGIAAADARGNLGADPLGLLARTGDGADTARLLAEAAALAVRCDRELPGVRALTVDATAYHDAGASAAQELGSALATGVAYLRELTAAGLSEQAAAAQLEFRYAATADQFLTIAKLRAARRLWARVCQLSGVPAAESAQRQHAVTSSVMMTERDPWVNMLRTTLACMAAGVGGADAVSVLPFDAALGLPDAFARRIARNTQSVLLEESQLGRVIDPAGGSWYVEQLTDELAHAAWTWFQQVERAGGQQRALDSGLVQQRIAETWAQREEDLAHRREPVTGVSEFPNLAERLPVREPAPAPVGGGLPRVRRSRQFEALRARADARLAATGERPRVFLAAIGPAAAYTGRSTFAANLFQAGGIETVLGEGADAAALAEAFTASGATVACLCSSDRLYAEQAEAVAAALGGAGAERVLLAGKPGGLSGVDDYVFTGCDAVAVLSSTLDLIGAV
ncbi:methylmalonyl-CoA mutase small subunit [Streptacidiphilus sp. P02-A3a]|uniref:methylmalonyl-CoA mutase small subunit n=1 Tax=Streptacidiphilus sp. P02-A3a TaxID=2704468 RepID=UPI0015FA0A19|nr:methylmalonyl-CoA mutase small subunit [Streptacidiphilus sp. P02-A3a]QMU70917.1 methylmalonyl-CoA mutase small subunit [Streptacidiphilus sp. P02-A3a]